MKKTNKAKSKTKAARKEQAEKAAEMRSAQRRLMLFAIAFFLLGTWCLLNALGLIGDGTGRIWRWVGTAACYFCTLQMLAQIAAAPKRKK